MAGGERRDGSKVDEFDAALGAATLARPGYYQALVDGARQGDAREELDERIKRYIADPSLWEK